MEALWSTVSPRVVIAKTVSLFVRAYRVGRANYIFLSQAGQVFAVKGIRDKSPFLVGSLAALTEMCFSNTIPGESTLGLNENIPTSHQFVGQFR
jgi:hypothetical protein